MAVPDWPLSFGSLNPTGWWADFPVRLEHGHRLLAAGVGVAVGVLCAAVWDNWAALKAAFLTSVVASGIAGLAAFSPLVRAHLGIWPAAVVFIVVLTRGSRSHGAAGNLEKRLALAAFVLVCCQATLGGLRVTEETAGALRLATLLRIFHGCVAQAFLAVLVALAVRLAILASPVQGAVSRSPSVRWVAASLLAVYGQLIVGATMRHLGAGLAIPTFPAANPSGGLFPQSHNAFTDLNFTHTRLGAIVVLFLVLVASFKAWKAAGPEQRVRVWSSRAALAVILQAVLGVLVILHQKPRSLATLHVVLGASLLACLVAMLVHLCSAPKIAADRA